MPFCIRNKQTKNGFSLLELLLVLSLMVTIGLWSAPAWHSVYQSIRMHLMVSDIKTAIQCAKIQAMVYHQPIQLSPLVASNDWSKGIAVRLNDHILQAWPWSVQGVSLTWHGFQSSSGLLFSSDSARNAVNGVFLIQSDHDKIKLVVNRLARVTP